MTHLQSVTATPVTPIPPTLLPASTYDLAAELVSLALHHCQEDAHPQEKAARVLLVAALSALHLDDEAQSINDICTWSREYWAMLNEAQSIMADLTIAASARN